MSAIHAPAPPPALFRPLTAARPGGIRHILVKVLILPLCVGLAVVLICDAAAADMITALSSSGQFVAREIQAQPVYPGAPAAIQTPVARGWAFVLPARPLAAITNPSTITLEPSLVVVSCERLKSLFLLELGLDDRWQGKISLMLYPFWPEDRQPQIAALYHPDGWNYELALPQTIQQQVLVRAVIETLLLELANRNAASHCAEVPAWLVEGLCAHLQAFSLPTFILQPDRQIASDNVKLQGLNLVRNQLRRHDGLTFQQLSWPAGTDLTGEGLELYRGCSQLFLEKLLELPDGKDCLRKMLRQFPDHLNWQTAFLLAFHSHFDQLLDVEKWWALSRVNFSQAQAASSATAQEARKRLRDSLDVPVQIRLDPARIPSAAKVTLQEVIAQWPPLDTAEALRRAVEQLLALQPRAPADLRPLVDLYLKTLLDYLRQSQVNSLGWGLGKHHPSVLDELKASTIKALDVLDQRRAALPPLPAAPASSKSSELSATANAAGSPPPTR